MANPTLTDIDNMPDGPAKQRYLTALGKDRAQALARQAMRGDTGKAIQDMPVASPCTSVTRSGRMLAVGQGNDIAGTSETIVGGILRYTLSYPPLLNNLFVNVGKRRVRSKRAQAYKDLAQNEILAQKQGFWFTCPVSVTIRAYRPRKCGDLDGVPKLVLDALSGRAYVDDKQIEELHLYRFDDKLAPRVEIEVKAL